MTINANQINATAINAGQQAASVAPPVYGAYIGISTATSFSLTKKVGATVTTLFDINALDTIKTTLKTTFSLLTATNASVELPIDATLTTNDTVIDIISGTLSQDEDSWTWAFNVTVADQGNWDAIKPRNGYYPDVVLTVRGIVFNLMVEGMQRSRRDVNNTWAISGRGKTARLDGKYASGVESSWKNINAQAIMNALCNDAGITLDYQAVDWQIKELEGQGRYPIEIINEIATAIGAVVQTSVSGTLIVRPMFAHNPAKYGTVTPEHIITDLDDYITLDEQWIDRHNYNSISIGDEEVDETLNDKDAQLSITSEDHTDLDGNKLSDQKLVKIYSVPFIADISLQDSAELWLALLYQGVMTEFIHIDALEIIQGSASVSLPFYELISYTYVHSDLGEITMSENGELKTEIDGQSLVNLVYKTKYHQYMAARISTDKYLQVFAEVEE